MSEAGKWPEEARPGLAVRLSNQTAASEAQKLYPGDDKAASLPGLNETHYPVFHTVISQELS